MTRVHPFIALAAALLWLPGAARGQGAPAEPPALGTYQLSAVEELPELLNRRQVAREISRRYPPHLRAQGIGGTVTLRMRVQADGSVDTTSIALEVATNPDLVPAATQVAQTLRFRPARVGGKPVRAWVTLPITFHTSLPPAKREEPWPPPEPGSRP
ncbi:MAG TPA: energy transducer TonB [Longimicrobium sp.]|jgi:TonB family protein